MYVVTTAICRQTQKVWTTNVLLGTSKQTSNKCKGLNGTSYHVLLGTQKQIDQLLKDDIHAHATHSIPHTINRFHDCLADSDDEADEAGAFGEGDRVDAIEGSQNEADVSLL